MPILGWRKKPVSGSADIDMSGWHKYPVHLMDGSKLNHKVLGWMMRFDDVLDAEMLHSALTRLLGMGDWRKLGGRLRRDTQKKDNLNIIVPKEFSLSHPAVEYQHNVFPQSISSHPIGAQVIRPTAAPTAQPLEKHLSQFMTPEGYPDTVDGLLQTTKSQLALTISSFDDATLVSLALPQTLLDVSGVVSLVQNWSLVLAGRESDVAPLLNTQHDILDDVTAANNVIAPQDCLMEKIRITGFGYLKLLGRHMAEATQRKRRLQALYIPRDTYQALLAKLRQEEAVSEKDDHASNETASACTEPKIQDMHLLLAWLIHIIAAQESDTRPLALITLYDLRLYIQKLNSITTHTDKGAGDSGHISQILMSSHCATFPADILRNTNCNKNANEGTQQTRKKNMSNSHSVGRIAKSYREQAAALTTEDEAIAQVKAMRKELCSEKPGFALYGTSDSLVVFCHPFEGVDVARMADFAPAVVPGEKAAEEGQQGEKINGGEKGKEKMTPAGRIVGNVFNAVNWTDAGVDTAWLLGEDCGGGCWVVAKLSAGSWDGVLGELKGL
ncbi:hypothetical protein E4U17_007916 [Claviceps sp. LM77 group G4]|nr:hypothetical protein E4U17_007916 [Claviceps sp. LM77 group G4]KAG6050088.1 hypothetical protein E4U33_000737 [Claviceps sp. LM78 group G4]KAG6077823.1 hypothetical protein E4U16_002002 [Claviceps sp. LM84 group G4]